MNRLLLLCLISLYACQPRAGENDENTSVTTDPVPVVSPVPRPVSGPEAATGIAGDFNGDGVIDTAWCELVKQSPGPDEPGIYALKFNTSLIPDMDSIDGFFRLINEGDLNGDGLPELSLFQSPLHGTVYSMTTWALATAGWKRIAGPWLIPTAGEYPSEESLQNRIVLENDTVYFWQEDMSDEHFIPQKHVLPLEK
ncbi:hypothetical protein [Chitinophaga sp.]|uniref:hypothetical protein n=1 Tax=Chitinophaga sp. TaxID=1869181 RepID=UPI002639686C|nr:hypothetical protein [uncultured Chitinophaga sp.]